jgi:hypothetical protein
MLLTSAALLQENKPYVLLAHPDSKSKYSSRNTHDEIHYTLPNLYTIMRLSGMRVRFFIDLLRQDAFEMSGFKKKLDDSLIEFRMTLQLIQAPHGLNLVR